MRNSCLALLGLAAGFCGAALGIGGGTITIPALILLFGYDIKKTLGTSLATSVPIAFIGMLTHYLICPANVRFRAGLAAVLGSVIGAWCGAKLASKVKSSVLRVLFSLLLFFVALKLMDILKFSTGVAADRALYPLLVVLGLGAGTVSAFFGVGGGILLVPGFLLFFGFSVREAIATSLFVILPTALLGCMFHTRFNNIDLAAVRSLVPASLLGAAAGATASENLPSGILKTAFGVVMLFCSVRIFFEKKQVLRLSPKL